MNWRFTIIDRDNVATIIDEPVGWDATNIIVRRDLEKHGVFYDYQGNDFRFYKEAMEIIKAENNAYGVEGQLLLKIEQGCDNLFVELYTGRMLFASYRYSCGDECFVTIPIETTGDIMQFTNRFDQKVNLQTEVAFDEVTALAPYDRLPFDITLPSKGIFLQDSATNETETTASFSDHIGHAVDGAFADPSVRRRQIDISFFKQVAGEIGDFFVNSTPNSVAIFDKDADGETNYTPIVAGTDHYPPFSSPTINFHDASPNVNDISNPIQVDFHIDILVKAINSSLSRPMYVFARLPDKKDEEDLSHYEYIYEHSSLAVFFGDMHYTADFTGDVIFNKGDRFYLLFAYTESKNEAQVANVAAGQPSSSVTVEVGSYFKATNLSHTKPSISKVFMVNEAISRITEAITDDKIRAYSDYFGRTDSQPYSHLSDGCGSLESITKGLFMRRQENRIPDQPFLMTVSMKDMWDGLEPVHHIGFGMEADTNRPGFNRLRVEPWQFFYKDELVMYCDGVNKIDRKTIESEHYSTFRFGYQKWEAEEYNGLDEFLTKRGYRSMLTQVKNELSKLSSFITSGYAWEITRRKGDIDSKDWRYDNENFLVCLVRGGTYDVKFGSGGFSLYRYGTIPEWATVGNTITITGAGVNNGTYTIDSIEGPLAGTGDVGILLGVATTPDPVLTTININSTAGIISVELGNVTAPANIIDPPTLYNYRISPLRIALKWMDKVFASYKHQGAGSRLLFTDGDGNYYAAGEMTSETCKWEAGVLAENATIDLSVFADQLKAYPLLSPERVEFEYPMSVLEFSNIKANPYGYIAWDSGCDEGMGWIDSINYEPEEGKARFSLIPKYL